MELLNEMYKAREAGAVGTPEWEEATEIYLKMLAPVCPHIAEELWTTQMGKPYSIHQQSWPKVDEAAAKEDVIEIPVQVNGKVRDRISLPAGRAKMRSGLRHWGARPCSNTWKAKSRRRSSWRRDGW